MVINLFLRRRSAIRNAQQTSLGEVVTVGASSGGQGNVGKEHFLHVTRFVFTFPSKNLNITATRLLIKK
jgi:hypothetical protein